METKYLCLGIIVFAVIAAICGFGAQGNTEDTTVYNNDYGLSEDFILPRGMEVLNSNDYILNAQHDGLSHTVHLMLEKVDNEDEAYSSQDAMYDGDYGLTKGFCKDGQWYRVQVYAVGGELGTDMGVEHVSKDINTIMDDFLSLNHIA